LGFSNKMKSAQIIFELIIILLLSLWVWSLINISRRRDLSLSQKIIWWLVCLIFIFFGAAAYALLGRVKYSVKDVIPEPNIIFWLSAVTGLLGYILFNQYFIDWAPTERPYSVSFQNRMIDLALVLCLLSSLSSVVCMCKSRWKARLVCALVLFVSIAPLIIVGLMSIQ